MNKKLQNFIGGTMIVGALGLPLAAKPLPLTADEPTNESIRESQIREELRQYAENYCRSTECQDIEEHVRKIVAHFDAGCEYYKSDFPDSYIINARKLAIFYYFEGGQHNITPQTEISN